MIKAYWAAEHEAEMKRRTKRQEQVIKRWQRLIQGLRIRQRLQEQYAGKGPQQSTEHSEEAEQLEQVSNTLSQCNLYYRLLRPGRSRTNKELGRDGFRMEDFIGRRATVSTKASGFYG